MILSHWLKQIACDSMALPVLALSLAFTANAQTTSDGKAAHEPLLPASARATAPGFSLTDAQGRTIDLAAYKGKVVLLDFWATWCGGCKLEIPWYIEFDQRYKDRGLSVVGVAMDEEGWKAVRPFLALETDPETGGHTAMKYPVVLGSDDLMKRFGAPSLPTTLLIDRQGKIALIHTGVVDKQDFEANLQHLLGSR